jgi:hypothetical protein
VEGVVLRKSEGVEENVRMINTDCVEMYEIENQVWDQVSDQVEHQVWYQVEHPLYAQVRDQVMNQVWLKVFR